MIRGWRLFYKLKVGRNLLVCTSFILSGFFLTIGFVCFLNPIPYSFIIGMVVCFASVIWTLYMLLSTFRQRFQFDSIREMLFLPRAYVCRFEENSMPYLMLHAYRDCTGQFAIMPDFMGERIIYGAFQNKHDAMLIKMRYG